MRTRLPKHEGSPWVFATVDKLSDGTWELEVQICSVSEGKSPRVLHEVVITSTEEPQIQYKDFT